MADLEGKHEISVVGQTYSVATSSSSQSKKLVSDPSKTGPKTFIITATEDTHLRMGPESGFTVTTDDFLLAGGAYIKVTVRKKSHNTLYFIESTTGVIYVTELDNETPGKAASGSSTDFDS